MKKLTLALTMAVIGLNTMAQGGVRELQPFDHLEVRGDIQVYLYEGDSLTAEAMVEDLPMDKLILEQDGDKLLIKIQGDFFKGRDVQVKVTYKDLRTLVARQQAEVRVKDTIEMDKLVVQCRSGGKVLGYVNTKSLELDIDAGGSMNIKGETDYVEATVNAGGTISCDKLVAKRAKATATSGGDITVRFVESLEAKATTWGKIKYYGDANKVDQKVNTGGTAERMEEK